MPRHPAVLILCAGLLLLATPSHAGFGDALKKLKDKSDKKTQDAVDKAVKVVEEPGANKDSTTASAGSQAARPEAAPAAGPAAADTKVAAVSTKFDYVPGDKVILSDDFTQDDLGEFPVRFKAITGNFEVAESGGERWLRCMSPDGTVRLRLPEAPSLPEYWTLEFDFSGTEPMEGALSMALDIRLWASTQPMITNVRYAEGCKPAQDLLATGKLVTYGIHFATGSDVVLADSAPILRQVAAWMQAHPTAKLSIVGHTDNVGAAAGNLDLSKRRAASVARVLSEQFSIQPDRLAPEGRGDTQSVASNDKPEGRAMNRRVEFARL